MKFLLLILACLVYPAAVFAGRGDTLVHAQLLADVSDVAPGSTFHVGVLLKIEPEWHIYWKNPGDSGLATTVKLALPPGFTSGNVEYPFPDRLVLPGAIVNYAYEVETMLIIPVTAPKDLAQGTAVAISAKINWLVCKDVCMPGTATADLSLPAAGTGASANGSLFDRWTGRIPLPSDPAHVADVRTETNLKQAASGLTGSSEITIQWKALPSDIQWFPAPPSGVILSDVKVSIAKGTTNISYHADVSSDSGNNSGIDSVVVYTIPGGRRMALAIVAHGK